MDDLSDAWDEDDEYYYVGIRRVVAQRQGRLEKEREMIDKAEKIWSDRLGQEKERKDANQAALVRLFRSMPILNRVELLEWSCERELRAHGIEDKVSYVTHSVLLCWLTETVRKFAANFPTLKRLICISNN
jgi:hypothetical protein